MKHAVNRLKRCWKHIYKNPVWAGLMVVCIAAVVPVIKSSADRLVPESAPKEPARLSGRKGMLARGTRFYLSMPTNGARVLPLIGHISAMNTEPKQIYDAVFLRSHKRFSVQYVWGSAMFLSSHTHHAYRLSDDIVGDGVTIGFRRPDGVFPACLCDSGSVALEVHIVPPLPAATVPEEVTSR